MMNNNNKGIMPAEKIAGQRIPASSRYAARSSDTMEHETELSHSHGSKAMTKKHSGDMISEEEDDELSPEEKLEILKEEREIQKQNMLHDRHLMNYTNRESNMSMNLANNNINSSVNQPRKHN
ncbi:hypothetical protein AYI70_g1462 [Smittium culicis]|uniref:Uncharacterized protein n=1 Tax=Smittium culicis TaxID=133412 RepID=A0A1R1X286_9FUNG|nr:hypothetical protein AYI70_g11357 [Smittium culicis]OMJ24628.1 hypothetical protein AYI70_g1462 [Smittium culicis]